MKNMMLTDVVVYEKDCESGSSSKFKLRCVWATDLAISRCSVLSVLSPVQTHRMLTLRHELGGCQHASESSWNCDGQPDLLKLQATDNKTARIWTKNLVGQGAAMCGTGADAMLKEHSTARSSTAGLRMVRRGKLEKKWTSDMWAHQRYFVLYEDSLCYYDDENDFARGKQDAGATKRNLALSHLDIIPEGKRSKSFKLRWRSPENDDSLEILTLQANDVDEKDLWIDDLKRCGCCEYSDDTPSARAPDRVSRTSKAALDIETELYGNIVREGVLRRGERKHVGGMGTFAIDAMKDIARGTRESYFVLQQDWLFYYPQRADLEKEKRKKIWRRCADKHHMKTADLIVQPDEDPASTSFILLVKGEEISWTLEADTAEECKMWKDDIIRCGATNADQHRTLRRAHQYVKQKLLPTGIGLAGFILAGLAAVHAKIEAAVSILVITAVVLCTLRLHQCRKQDILKSMMSA
eukprot:SAG31_NODE_2300_length_5980_cov_17.062744_3_plen_467_part_00